MAIISLETTQTIVDDPQCLCGLNQNELLRIIAYYTALGMGVSDVQDMVDDSACLCGLNQNQLLRIIAYYMGSGGAAGGQRVYAGDYSGGEPTDTPTADAALAIDTSNGTIWSWYDSAWH